MLRGLFSNKEKSTAKVMLDHYRARSDCPIMAIHDRIQMEQGWEILEEKLATNLERHKFYNCQAFVDKRDNCDKCGNIGTIKTSRPRENLLDLYKELEKAEKDNV